MREVPSKRRRWVERWPYRHYNPHKNLVMLRVKPSAKSKPRNVELETSQGGRDKIWVYREKHFVYVLCINRDLNYVGLAEYNLRQQPEEQRAFGQDKDYLSVEPWSEAFFQHDYHLKQVLGPRMLDQSERAILRRMMQYLPDR